MKAFSKLSIIGIVALFFSCSTEESLIPSRQDDFKTIPVEEVRSLVLEYAKKLYPETRAAIDITNSEVLPLTMSLLSISTRAKSLPEIPDTSFYIFNFPDESGFAVASANTKYGRSLICMTEKGSLQQEDFLPVRTRASSDSSVLDGGSHFIADLIGASIMSNEIAPPIDSTEIGGGISGLAGPYLMTRWGQSISPFNDKTPSHLPTGCDVVALAQIMAFEEYSNTMVFDGVNCTWSDMKTVYTYPNYSSYSGTDAGKLQVASFIIELASEDNCNIDFNNGSGGHPVNVRNTLQNYGYSNVVMTPGAALPASTSFTHNMHSLVRTQLYSGHPVFARGQRSGGGHAWVIDGCILNFYHINWGLYGYSNGYYNAGVFSIPDLDHYSSIDLGEESSLTHNYSYGYRLITFSHQ